MTQLTNTMEYWRSECGKLHHKLALEKRDRGKLYTEIRILKDKLKEKLRESTETVSNNT